MRLSKVVSTHLSAFGDILMRLPKSYTSSKELSWIVWANASKNNKPASL